MPWIIGGAAIIGGLISADSSRSASNKASDSSKYAADIQKQIFDQQRADQAPYRQAGYSALDQLKLLLGLGGNAKDPNYGMLTRQFTGRNLQSDPGYQFGLDQGTQALERSASARGGLYSGATMKALEKYGQDYAGTKFNEAFNRNQAYQDSLFNRLSGISGTGQTATNQVGQAGQNYANNVGNIATNNGNFQAAAALNQGNILSNVVNQAGAWYANRNNGWQSNHPEYSADGTGMWFNG